MPSTNFDRNHARRQWRVPAGESPARVMGSARPVVSVAAWADDPGEAYTAIMWDMGSEPR